MAASDHHRLLAIVDHRVFIALWLTGVDLNITALMGMTMIIGIGTEMAIFYVSEYTELAHAWRRGGRW